MNEFHTSDVRRVLRRQQSQRFQPGSAPPISKPGRKRRLLLVAIILMVLVMAIGVGIWLVVHGRQMANLNDVVTVKKRVSRHVVLPTTEEPALATVTDKSKVSTPFLQQAENGDKVLVYQNAKKVILYRPSTDRVVDMGPVTIAPLESNP